MANEPDLRVRMSDLARDANTARTAGEFPGGGWPARDAVDTSGTGAIRHPAETGDLLGSSVAGRKARWFRPRNLALLGGVAFGVYAIRKGMQSSSPRDDSPADGIQ